MRKRGADLAVQQAACSHLGLLLGRAVLGQHLHVARVGVAERWSASEATRDLPSHCWPSGRTRGWMQPGTPCSGPWAGTCSTARAERAFFLRSSRMGGCGCHLASPDAYSGPLGLGRPWQGSADANRDRKESRLTAGSPPRQTWQQRPGSWPHGRSRGGGPRYAPAGGHCKLRVSRVGVPTAMGIWADMMRGGGLA